MFRLEHIAKYVFTQGIPNSASIKCKHDHLMRSGGIQGGVHGVSTPIPCTPSGLNESC